MKRLSSKFILVLLSLIVALPWTLHVASAVVYDQDFRNHWNTDDEFIVFEVNDNEDLDVIPGGTYFYYIMGMLPGDSLTKDFVVTNNSHYNYSYDLKFWTSDGNWSSVTKNSDGSSTVVKQGKLNLLEAIQLKIYYDGELFYQGPLSGEGKDKNGNPRNTNVSEVNALLLKSNFASNSTVRIHTEVFLDGEKIGNEWQSAWCFIRWNFSIYRPDPTTDEPSTEPPIPSTPPPSGEIITDSPPPGGLDTPMPTPTSEVVTQTPPPGEIVPETPGPISPITGDNARFVFYLVSSLLSVAALAVILFCIKRKKHGGQVGGK